MRTMMIGMLVLCGCATLPRPVLGDPAVLRVCVEGTNEAAARQAAEKAVGGQVETRWKQQTFRQTVFRNGRVEQTFRKLESETVDLLLEGLFTQWDGDRACSTLDLRAVDVLVAEAVREGWGNDPPARLRWEATPMLVHSALLEDVDRLLKPG